MNIELPEIKILGNTFFKKEITKSNPEAEETASDTFAAEMGFWSPKEFDLVNHHSVSSVIRYLHRMKIAGYIYHEESTWHNSKDFRKPKEVAEAIRASTEYSIKVMFRFTDARPFYRFITGNDDLIMEIHPTKHTHIYLSIDRSKYTIDNNLCHCYVSISESIKSLKNKMTNDIEYIPQEILNDLFNL